MFLFTVNMVFQLMSVIIRMNRPICMGMRMSMIMRFSVLHALDDLLLHHIHVVHHRHDALRPGSFLERVQHL